MIVRVSIWRDKHGDVQIAMPKSFRLGGFRARITNNPRSVACHPYLHRKLLELLSEAGEG